MKKLLIINILMIAFSLISCKSEHIQINNGTTINLYQNSTHQIDAESRSDISFYSDNDFYAEVTENGFVNANYVGSTKIHLSNDIENVTIDVNIVPLNNYYPEPNICLGESRESVNAKYALEGTWPIQNDTILYPYLSDVTDWIYVYYEDDKVISYEVLINFKETDYEQEVPFDDYKAVENCISERYKYIGDIAGNPIFINALKLSDATMSVTYLDHFIGYITVRYYGGELLTNVID